MYKTEAIVLRQRRFGEADRFLTVYTPAHGKMDVKARGVRKTTSRMSGHLQPLTRCMLSAGAGACERRRHRVRDAGELPTSAGRPGTAEPRDVRSRTDRPDGAGAGAELSDVSAADWRRCGGWPRRRTPDQVLRFFEMRLVDQCGFRPELERLRGLWVGAGAGRELLRAAERRRGLPRLRRRPERDAGAFDQRVEGVASASTRVV